MQYIWRWRLWPEVPVRGVRGERILVVDPGVQNTGSGPDFFNAVLRIDGQTYAGTVEMHVHASDWHRHNHDGDPAYDNVILHVVRYDDCEIRVGEEGRLLPQVVMDCSVDFPAHYRNLVNNPDLEVPCAQGMKDVPRIFITDWITSLAMERLQRKADDVRRLAEGFADDWKRAAFVTLARGLGSGTNADAMERVARSLPLKILERHHDNYMAIEAMLMGQAGLLAEYPRDRYEERLKEEYAFYSRKFGLKAEDIHWQLRTRPQNAPVRRLALLAHIVQGGFAFAGCVFNLEGDEDPRDFFNVEPNTYWLTHLSYGHPCESVPTLLSYQMTNLLLINVVAPLVYAWGDRLGDDSRRERVIDMLQKLPAESNSIVRMFDEAGLKSRDAFTSQAVIQLRRNYCETRKCLFCRLGHRLLASKVPTPR